MKLEKYYWYRENNNCDWEPIMIYDNEWVYSIGSETSGHINNWKGEFIEIKRPDNTHCTRPVPPAS